MRRNTYGFTSIHYDDSRRYRIDIHYNFGIRKKEEHDDTSRLIASSGI